MRPSRIIRSCVFSLLSIPLFIAAGIVVFYVEENWRGPHTWAKAEAEMEQKGETTDYAKLVPPAVPDDQNLGALPLFDMDPDPTEKNALKPLKLTHAFENISSDAFRLTGPSRMYSGQTADLEAISASISKRYREVFKLTSGHAEPSTLDELDALCPAIGEIRVAALARPFCRFNQDYTSLPPYTRPLGLATKFITVAGAFSVHGILALHEGKPALAFDDMRTLFKIDAELRREPLLVNGLVSAGVMAIEEQVIWEGLNTHAWSDAQLTELAASLKVIDFISTFQLSMRGEVVGYFIPQMDEEERNLKVSDITGMSNPANETGWEFVGREEMNVIAWVAPRGWFSISKTTGAMLFFDGIERGADPSTHRFYPGVLDEVASRVRPKDLYSPGEILRGVVMGPILNSGCKFAQSQAQVDAAWIATEAERFRLAHGAYPKSPDDLTALAGSALPRDIVNGEPYRYSIEPNGSLLIYSVGWNLIDEGGKRIFDSSTKRVDTTRGDWPWPALGIDTNENN